ncbi:hypothetical protein [Streptomyces sp. NPDC005970]|uniref:hypothetical protein n=1 Tax=Streptomyces sp. NPDC005970 TaxID=3156723 RepID=UPI0033E00727
MTDHPYVPGPGQIVGSWFPSPTGTTGVGGPVLPYEVHIFTSVLGGLAVGLLWCGARALTRAAALVPMAGAVAIHWVTNYAAAFPRNHTAMEWRERLAADWGLWTILGCLALAWIWDSTGVPDSQPASNVESRHGCSHCPGSRTSPDDAPLKAGFYCWHSSQ